MFFIGFKNPLSTPPLGAATNHLRLKLSATPFSWMSVETAYDFSPRIQDPSLFQGSLTFAAIDPFTYRIIDFDNRIYPGKDREVSSFALFHNLDRLMFTIKVPFADIKIGRQPIAWGSARFINPTDIIAPFAFNDLDTEDRLGVDAIRVLVPLGDMEELDTGYIFGKDMKFRNSSVYIRGKIYILKTDISALLMKFRDNLLLGLDVARAIGGAGFWLEAAYVIPQKEESSKNYFRASLGMDYNFTGTFYGFFEYHFNSPGKGKPEEYPLFFSNIAFTQGADYLLGRHYLNLGTTLQISPLIPFSGMVIINMTDGSMILSPTIEYNIAENIYLSAGAYLGIGKQPEIKSTFPSEEVRYHSEFGAYPMMIYSSFRIYF